MRNFLKSIVKTYVLGFITAGLMFMIGAFFIYVLSGFVIIPDLYKLLKNTIVGGFIFAFIFAVQPINK